MDDLGYLLEEIRVDAGLDEAADSRATRELMYHIGTVEGEIAGLKRDALVHGLHGEFDRKLLSRALKRAFEEIRKARNSASHRQSK